MLIVKVGCTSQLGVQSREQAKATRVRVRARFGYALHHMGVFSPIRGQSRL